MNNIEEAKQEIVRPKDNYYLRDNMKGTFAKSAALMQYNRSKNKTWGSQRRFPRPFGNPNAPFKRINASNNMNSFRAYPKNSYSQRFAPRRWNGNRRFGFRQRRNFKRPFGPVFNFLTSVPEIDKPTLAKAEAIAAQILAVQRPTRPQTAFARFLAESYKNDPQKKFVVIRKEWLDLPQKEKQEKIEANWKEFQIYKANMKEYNKKVGDYEAELQIIQGLQPIKRRIFPPRAFDIFWKDVEAKVISEMPNASPYELEMKHRSLWKELTRKEKQLYIALSRVEAEKTTHEFRLTKLKNLIQRLKNDIEKDKKKSVQEVSANTA